MDLRPRKLSSNWYPDTHEGTLKAFSQWELSSTRRSKLVVVPHASWFFSGSIGYEMISSLSQDLDTVIVLGGHNPMSNVMYAYTEKHFATALGEIENNTTLLERIRESFPVKPDYSVDNTIEVQLPFIQHFFPKVPVLAMRVGNGVIASDLGDFLVNVAQESRIAVIVSTDLIHYGPQFSYTPKGNSFSAVEWCKQKDNELLKQCSLVNISKANALLQDEHCACSRGALSLALSYAKGSALKCVKTQYKNSYDIHQDSSFVGYMGLSYESKPA